MFLNWLKVFFLYLIITIIAFVCVEVFVRTVLKFPTLGFGKTYHIYPNDKTPSSPVYENEIKSHATYYTTEGGYQVYHKNNLGLPGTDVVTGPDSKYIYVCGNSYVEARASQPQNIATSVFMELLHRKVSKDYQVINVGLGGQIPYYDWCRLHYWSQKFKPDYVILVVTDGTITNMMKNPDLRYVLPDNFGQEVKNWKFNIIKVICNNSAFTNLLRVTVQKSGITVAPVKTEKLFFRPYDDYVFSPESYKVFLSTLLEFQKTYGDRFICFSLMNNTCNRRTALDCKNLGIKFAYDGDLKNDNKNIIEGGAHYTNKGNKIFGLDLYNAFIQLNKN